MNEFRNLKHDIDTFCDEIEKNIRSGMDINTVTRTGASVLMRACDRISYCRNLFNCETIRKFITYLLEHGANPNLQDENGMTALMYACIQNKSDMQLEIIELLLHHRSSVNLQNNTGKTALMLLQSSPNIYGKRVYYEPKIESIRTLIDAGANVNMQDCKGRTILMIYLSKSKKFFIHNDDILKKKWHDLIIDLISKSDISIQDVNGRTAYYYFTENQSDNLVLSNHEMSLLRNSNTTKPARSR